MSNVGYYFAASVAILIGLAFVSWVAGYSFSCGFHRRKLDFLKTIMRSGKAAEDAERP